MNGRSILHNEIGINVPEVAKQENEITFEINFR